MKQKFAKNLHIINCLVSFCHYAGATDYNIRFKHEQGFASFAIEAAVQNMDPRLLHELNEALKLKRSHEVEQDYWELGGEADSQNELTLIGMMLDESSVAYKDNTLAIHALRKG